MTELIRVNGKTFDEALSEWEQLGLSAEEYPDARLWEQPEIFLRKGITTTETAAAMGRTWLAEMKATGTDYESVQVSYFDVSHCKVSVVAESD